ncbi:MAG: hypothetical protein R6U85_12780 [Salinivirgaceae bacterium]
MIKKAFIIVTMVVLAINAFGQVPPKKMWVSGYARSTIFMDEITQADSTPVPKTHYGHTLIDLSANIRPNKSTFIRGTVRIRNEYGGFWGSGITFDLRELYVKGLIANTVRYQLGDINYKLTPFTLHNYDEAFAEKSLDIFKMYRDMLHNDLFYNEDNTWRQQGAAVDFALTFSKLAEEMKFNFFASRINPTDFGPTEERLFAGANASLIQSKYLTAGVNYINMFDLEGTSTDTLYLRNPVISGTYALKYDLNNMHFELNGEGGASKAYIENNDDLPTTEDFFGFTELKATYNPLKITFKAAFRDVGANFRSPGAQMRRLKFGVNPMAYERYTGDEILRPVGMWDFMNDPSMYNTQISNKLLPFYPQYSNIEPYGMATPNRTGFDFTLMHQGKNDSYSLTATYKNLNEVIGQGTEELRNFQVMAVDGVVNIDKFLSSFDRKIAVQLGYENGSTQRESDLEFEQVDLKTETIRAGLTFEFVEKFELLAGVQLYTAKGNEEIAERDQQNDVYYFHSFNTDLKEDMLGAGLRYTFAEKMTLQALYQKYTWSDKELTQKPDYGFNRIAVVFQMKF